MLVIYRMKSRIAGSTVGIDQPFFSFYFGLPTLLSPPHLSFYVHGKGVPRDPLHIHVRVLLIMNVDRRAPSLPNKTEKDAAGI